jgi:hypothetical protein
MLSPEQRLVREAHRTGAEHATHTERPQGRTGRQVVRAVRMLVV